MAGSTAVFGFEISLSDVTRGVYEQLSLKVAQHPSETMDYLLTRVLAYSLEYREGLEFAAGLSDPDEPAIWAHDLTGKLTCWIEVGSPSAARLHKASKGAERVAVYTYKDPAVLIGQLTGARVHRADKVQIFSFDKGFLSNLSTVISRRNAFELSVSEGHLYLTVGGNSFTSTITVHAFE